jgi:hypothetical protein
VKVSPNGGTWPKWSNNELFFWQGNTLMSMELLRNPDQIRNEARPVFTGAKVGMGESNMMNSYNPEYDVSADGTRFVVVQRVGG